MELFFSTDIRQRALTLHEDEASHCIKVLRHKTGEIIFVTDGKGNLYRCTIQELGKKGPTVECTIDDISVGVGQRNYSLTMAVCPTKNIDRYEWFLEKATELGFDSLIPLISDHSIRTKVKTERLEAIALSAIKQSLKSYMPVIKQPVKVKDFLQDLFLQSSQCQTKTNTVTEMQNKEPQLKLIAYCEEEGIKKTIRQRIAEYARPAGSKLDVLILIGPEGDFSMPEIELARQAGFLPVTLGESRLRVETAAVAAVSEIYFYGTEQLCRQGISKR